MAGKLAHDKIYADLMAKLHPYGWALYKKVLTSEMQPGACGYFDEAGDWQLIGHISKPGDSFDNPWQPATTFGLQKPVSDNWGPKTSALVTERRIGGTAGSKYVFFFSFFLSFFFLSFFFSFFLSFFFFFLFFF
jgi:hypothetical protein